MKYQIKECWSITLLGMRDREYYTNYRKNLKEIKTYIKDWIESWKNSAKENNYKITSKRTDYRNYATVKIRTNSGLDTMSLKVRGIK